MYLAPICLSVLLFVVAGYADPQFMFGYPSGYPNNMGYQDPINYFRSGLPDSSFDDRVQKPEGRFFGTITYKIGTTTSTSTVTTSTTCTTSTGAISICSPSGRRRRGLNAKSRGLFYTEEEDHFDSIFVRPPETAKAEPIASSEHEARSAETLIPFIVQPGFNAPNDVRGGRLYVALGSSTITTTTTSTYTAILTAKCKSTTAFSTCSGSGK